MESSRIFVKHLPPNITEAAFRKHFTHGQITDIKLIPERRIGYVGYSNPAEAAKAVKLFNRSFIRMSKVSVELAKPIADPSLLKKTKQAKEQENDRPQEPNAEVNSKKRKRDALDQSDPKLQEFLDLGLGKKTKKSALDNVEVLEEKSTVDGGISDDEYEDVPKAKRVSRPTATKGAPREAKNPDDQNNQETVDDEPSIIPVNQPEVAASATDDDWLRSRTSRLLDLDDEIIPPTSVPSPPIQQEQEAEPAVPDEIESHIVSGEVDKSREDSFLETIRKTRRLFVRNLSYSTTEDELRAHFEEYGEVVEIHVPRDSSGNKGNKGFAFVLFEKPDAAQAAFHGRDKQPLNGRIQHLLPASAKRESIDELTLSKLPLKQQNLLRKKSKAANFRLNWNALYMSQDAVNTSMAERLGISKSELLDPTSSQEAVKQALTEASVIHDTKAYFKANGVDLDAFKTSQRGDTAILVKNYPHGTTAEEIRNLFEEHGRVLRVLMPPSGNLCIVQFPEGEAKTAFARLAYRRFKDSILFLEKAPKNLLVGNGLQNVTITEPAGVQKVSGSELLGPDNDDKHAESSTLFVRNLSFSTQTAHLVEQFQHLEGFKSALVRTKKAPQNPGAVLSMGFGFLEFSDQAAAQAALKTIDGHILHGHKLQARASHRGQDAAEQRKREDTAKKIAGQKTKIIVKNLPFQATKADVRALFSAHCSIRACRLPRNIQGRAKGYAFVEAASVRDAEIAMNMLRDVHLLGRKLSLELAEESIEDSEAVIEAMSKKTSRQQDKMTMQKLTGDRKRVVLGDEDDGNF